MPKPVEDPDVCSFCPRKIAEKPLNGKPEDAGKKGILYWQEYDDSTGKPSDKLVGWELHKYCFKMIKPLMVRKMGRPFKVDEEVVKGKG